MTNEQRKTFLQYLKFSQYQKTDNTDGKWLLTSDRIPVDCATGDCAEHNKRLVDPWVMERLIEKLAKKVRKRARSEDQDDLKIEYDSHLNKDLEEAKFFTGSYFGGEGGWRHDQRTT